MKLTTHIRNCIIIWRENKKPRQNLNTDGLITVAQTYYKRKNSWIRNQVAQLVKKVRKDNPYKIQDYSKAKGFYQNQPKGIDFSKVSTGKYVVKYTEYYAIKGKRYCEYYLNFNSGLGVFKVGKWNKEYEHFTLIDCKGRWGICSLEEEYSVMYRFATEKEIEGFEIRHKKYLETKKKIEEINKLYKEL